MTRVEQLARTLCQQEGRFPKSEWELYLSTAAEQLAFEDNPFGLNAAHVAELESLFREARVNYHGIMPLLHELASRGYRIAKVDDGGR